MTRASTLAARLRPLAGHLRPLGDRLRAVAPRFRHPAAVFGAFFVVLATVLAIGLGDDDEAGPTGLPLPPLSGAFVDPELGIRVSYPADWSAERRTRGESRAVVLRANDGSALVSVSPVAGSKLADKVLDAAGGQIREEYRRVERLGTQELEIAGQPGRARLFLGTNEEGQRLRILTATIEGDRRTYLINVFSLVEADLRIAQVEQILTSLQLQR